MNFWCTVHSPRHSSVFNSASMTRAIPVRTRIRIFFSRCWCRCLIDRCASTLLIDRCASTLQTKGVTQFEPCIQMFSAPASLKHLEVLAGIVHSRPSTLMIVLCLNLSISWSEANNTFETQSILCSFLSLRNSFYLSMLTACMSFAN
jgi:hypothetical protein